MIRVSVRRWSGAILVHRAAADDPGPTGRRRRGVGHDGTPEPVDNEPLDEVQASVPRIEVLQAVREFIDAGVA